MKTTKYFRSNGALIPVIIDHEVVNIGSMSAMSIRQFTKLASSVLAEYNLKYGTYQGFPHAHELEDK